MKRIGILFAVLVPLGLLASCKSSSEVETSAEIVLCGDCGVEKGTDACCGDAERCGDCNMIKGSPGCCK